MTRIETATNLVNIGLALMILCLGIRIVSTMRFSLQRGSVRLFVAAATIFAAKEMLGSLTGGAKSPFLHDLSEILETGFIICLCVAMWLIVKSENVEISTLHNKVNLDLLTGLLNLSAFSQVASRRVKYAKENGLPLTLLMLDLDAFKQYNDTYGHEAGNVALQSVAQTLRDTARDTDLVARYGGEEFILLLFTSPDAALPTAERIRVAIESQCSPKSNPALQRQITVSVGIARLSASISSMKELVEIADKELYQAKRAGRNRVSLAGA